MYDFVVSMMLLGAVSQAGSLPFWACANQFGLMPQDNGALAVLSAGTSYDNSKTFQWCWGASVAANRYDDNLSPESSPYHLMVDELYASARYKCLSIDLGAKHRDRLFLASGQTLGSLSTSSGHIIESGNARSMPGITLNLEPVAVPFTRGHLLISGSYGDYKTLDNRYMAGALIHRMRGYLRYKFNDNWYIRAGLDHYALWGGYNEHVTDVPVTLENYLRIITGRSAGASGSLSDQINVLGDHGGAEHLSAGYNNDKWSLTFQLEKPYNDKSGMRFANIPDALYTLHFGFADKDRWVSDVLLECHYTFWQSGTLHDREATPEELPKLDPNDWYGSRGRIVEGGLDDYFNNGEYNSGWTYYGHAIGSPLMVPEGTRDGTWTSARVVHGIEDSRVKALHFGIAGKLWRRAPYKLMVTGSLNYGAYGKPYIGKSTMGTGWKWWQPNTIDQPLKQLCASFTGEVPIVRGLCATYGLYADYGSLLPSQAGATLGLRYVFAR